MAANDIDNIEDNCAVAMYKHRKLKFDFDDLSICFE